MSQIMSGSAHKMQVKLTMLIIPISDGGTNSQSTHCLAKSQCNELAEISYRVTRTT